MDYANLSQKPSPSVTEHSLKSSKIPRRPSSRIHDASLVNCDSIVMERCETSLKSPLSVTSGPLSRKPGNVNNENVKKDEIEVYTVSFMVPSETVKTLLEKCATSNDHYFDADNSTQLNAAFAEIAKDLASIRLTN